MNNSSNDSSSSSSSSSVNNNRLLAPHVGGGVFSLYDKVLQPILMALPPDVAMNYAYMVWVLFSCLILMRFYLFPEYVVFDALLALGSYIFTAHVAWLVALWKPDKPLGKAWALLTSSYLVPVVLCSVINLCTWLVWGQDLIFLNMGFEAVVTAINHRQVQSILTSPNGFSDRLVLSVRFLAVLAMELADWKLLSLPHLTVWSLLGLVGLTMTYGASAWEREDPFPMLRAEASRQKRVTGIYSVERQVLSASLQARDVYADGKAELQRIDDSVNRWTVGVLSWVSGTRAQVNAIRDGVFQARETTQACEARSDLPNVVNAAGTVWTEGHLQDSNVLNLVFLVQENIDVLGRLLAAGVTLALATWTFPDNSPPPTWGRWQTLVEGWLQLSDSDSGIVVACIRLALLVCPYTLVVFFGSALVLRLVPPIEETLANPVAWFRGVSFNAGTCEGALEEWIAAAPGFQSWLRKYLTRSFDDLNEQDRLHYIRAAVALACRPGDHDQEEKRREQGCKVLEQLHEGGEGSSLAVLKELFQFLEDAGADLEEMRRQDATAVTEAIEKMLQQASILWLEASGRCNPSSSSSSSSSSLTEVLDRLVKQNLMAKKVLQAAVDVGNNRCLGQNGAQLDAKAAVRYFLAAAQHGYRPAQCRLFECFRDKVGISQDEKVDMKATHSQVTKGLYHLFGRGVSQDCKKAVSLFAAAASQGDPMGQFALGWCHEKGQGLPHDYNKAEELYKAAEAGNPLARKKLKDLDPFNKGVNHLVGSNGAQRDAKEAVRYFLQAAQQGYLPAQSQLFECFRDKVGISHDEEMDTEGAHSQVILGWRLLFGRGVPQDHKEAARLFAAAASQGDVMGQYALGRCYDYGQGVPQDYKKAIEWYTKAAEAGSSDAQNNLAVCYKEGQGVDQDYKEAVQWFTKAAEAGNSTAQHNLGVCYKNGQGVDQDYKKAVQWFTKAAEAGDSDAQCNLGFCYKNGQGVDQDYKKAVQWFTKAAEAGDSDAQCNLGFCYKNGQGVDQDYKKAVQWYSKAAEAGNSNAQYNLGNCYANGQGVPKDYKKAVEWHTKAAAAGDQDSKKILQELKNQGH